MARYRGSRGKLVRKFGENIFGSPKYDRILQKRNYGPGDHGPGFRKKESDYAIHLKEKQKVRYMYGLMERQFRNYFKKADKMKGVTGENLFQLLERRLDNVVYRMGFARTRNQALQMVNHGHIKVNDKKVNIPSYLIKPEDVIEVKDKSKSKKMFIDAVEAREGSSAYDWLETDLENLKGNFKYIPKREEIPVNVDDRLIVEYYSK